MRTCHIIDVFSFRHKNRKSFAVHYVKDGPKVDNTIEPQYETCAVARMTESEYDTGERQW